MHGFFILRSVLTDLDDGSLLRKVNAVILYLISFLIVGGVIYAVVNLLVSSSGSGGSSDGSGGLSVGLLIIAIIIALAVVLLEFQIFYVRASILWNEEDSRYGAMQVLSIVTRAIGEGVTGLLLAVGYFGMFAAWFEGIAVTMPLANLIPGGAFALIGIADGNEFVFGLLLCFSSTIYAVLQLTIVHFVSEWMVVAGEIAIRLRMMEQYTKEADAHAATVAPPLPPLQSAYDTP